MKINDYSKKKMRVDVAIIGAGTAGMSAYKAAVKYTDSIVMIEGDSYGTLCAKAGCMPSKLLIEAAKNVAAVEKVKFFGARSISVNTKEVLSHVRSERDRFVRLVKKEVRDFPHQHKIMSAVEFLDDHHLQLSNGTILVAKRIVIATGSHAIIPDILNGLGSRLLSSDTLFELKNIPPTLAIMGTGPIGLELGMALHELGSKIHFFGNRKEVGGLSDPKVNQTAIDIFGKQLPLDLESKVINVKRVRNKVEVTYQTEKGKKHKAYFSHILAATGRAPNIANLQLDRTSVRLDKHGTPRFNPTTMQCLGARHIFIAGDANHASPLLHIANDQGRLAGKNAANFPTVVRQKPRETLAITFSQPQIARAGERFVDLEKKKIKIIIGEASFNDQGRARMMGENQGLLRIYADAKTGRVLGSEMVGPAAEHLMHSIAWCIATRLTVEKMLALPFYHPTLEEAIRTALRMIALPK